MTEHILIIANVPNSDTAAKLAKHLVEARLAACVNILPAMQSVYRWQGQVEEANETALLIKTRNTLYERVEKAIVELHPYEVPEVISLSIMNGLPPYLSWITMETDS